MNNTSQRHSHLTTVPSKAEAILRNYIPSNLLTAISKNKEEAVEICLYALSIFKFVSYDENNDFTTNINQSQLIEILFNTKNFDSDNRAKLKNVMNVLTCNKPRTGALIVCNNEYKAHVKSFEYTAGKAYQNKGLVQYELKTDKVKNIAEINNQKRLEKIQNNIIYKNLVELYKKLSLPSNEEIISKANELIENKFITKKGKLLKFRGDKDKRYDNKEKYSYVEDSMDCFSQLWENGYSLKTIKVSEKCDRLTDPLNLSPSWIRSLIKIDGEQISEADYTCLHPNLVQNLMGGTGNHISHKSVAESLEMDLRDVKIEHLSFFNKKVWAMQKSPLYAYYKKNEPEMLKRVIGDKYTKGYTHITYKLFKLEVEIMTNVIAQLNDMGIYVMYVYDALYCKQSEFEIVKNIMNQTIKDFGINTFVK